MPGRTPTHSAAGGSAQLAPNAVSVDGLAQAGFLPSHFRAHRPGRSRNAADRRVVSYFNYFSSRSNISNDGPPTYSRSQQDARFRSTSDRSEEGREVLPEYTCTVAKESVMHMRVEACSPFMSLPFQEWRPVFVVMTGTQLCIHKIKVTTVGKEHVSGAGRLLRQYTLQHAEVGLAPDVEYSVMTPNTKLAALIPPVARRRAMQKDPDLFSIEKHFNMRLRCELDQFVLSHPSEEQIMSWVNHVCAGIDIAPALDDRALPRQTTMPRRYRRAQPREVNPTDITNERVIEQQRRLLAMYPSLAGTDSQLGERQSSMYLAPPSIASRSQSISPSHGNSSAQAITENEPEDIDLSVLAEDSGGIDRSVSDAGLSASASRSNSHAAMLTLEALNFDEDGKWAPPHPRTSAQQWRYVKRCMPVLLAETARHSSIMISGNRYVRPNYKLDVLEEWTSVPPAYEAHEFTIPSPVVLTNTMSSTTDTENEEERASMSSLERQPTSNGLSHETRVDSAANTTDLITACTAETRLSALKNMVVVDQQKQDEVVTTLPPLKSRRSRNVLKNTTATADNETRRPTRTLFGF